MHFNDLPLELKFCILSYLTQEELMLDVAPVCKNWYEMAYDPSLWKSLEIQSMDFMNFPELVPRLLTKFSGHIAALTLTYFNLNDWNQLVWNLSKGENLKKLCLLDCKINSIILHMLINNFPFIQELVVEPVGFVEENLFFKTNRWKKLKMIDIDFELMSENTDIDKCITFIAENFEDLIDICLRSIKSAESSFQHLGNLKGQKLVKFNFVSCHITDTNFINLGEKFTNLTELGFSSCRFNGNAFLAVKNLINLRSLLIVSCPGLQVNDFVRFFKGAIFFNLTKLDMFMCSLNDDVITLLPQCFPALETFELVNNNDVTEPGLTSALSRFRNLSRVGIYLQRESGTGNYLFQPNLSCLNICNLSTIATIQEKRSVFGWRN